MKNKQLKIGIVTFHNVYNYGGVLQAYALCNALNHYEVECIDYVQPDLHVKYSHKLYNKKKSLKENLKHFAKYYLFRYGKAKEQAIINFIQKYIKLSPARCFSKADVEAISSNYDILISGSDQIWNPKFTGKKLDDVYVLKFGNSKQQRIAYASSAGSCHFDGQTKEQLLMALNQFKAVGVREAFLHEQLSGAINPPLKTVVDPTLLLSSSEWLQVSKPVLGLPEKFILVYSFDNDPVCLQASQMLADLLDLKVVAISDRVDLGKSDFFDIQLNDLGPSEFVWLFSKAQFVVTNSFHGTTFSLIFSRNFYSVYKKNNPHRVINLLGSVDLSTRVIKSVSDINLNELEIDYTIPSVKLNELVTGSKDFLESAICEKNLEAVY